MMSVEGPFLAATIARLAQPTENLAAFGVAFAAAIIIESPVIMLLSASTALVVDRGSFLALRRSTYQLNAAITALMLIVLAPPVFAWTFGRLLALPPVVTELTYGALWLLLPWPAAIGYRRFYQGLLIRRGKTRWVAYGTIFRVTSMLLAGIGAAKATGLSGVEVGALALSAGVVVEALVSRFISRDVVAELERGAHPERSPHPPLTFARITAFYVPLAMTSALNMAVQPVITFFVGQSRSALESLAVLPVIHGLTFIFRSLGLSYHEVAVALLGDRGDQYRPLKRFAAWLGLWTSLGLALIAFTPLSAIWFERVSGLSPELARFALTPTRILAVFPALTVLLSFQRAILVHVRRTTPMTWATAVEVLGIGVVLWIAIGPLSLVGAVAASLAMLLGRVAGNLVMAGPCAEAVRTFHR
jgi:hypothetical protein